MNGLKTCLLCFGALIAVMLIMSTQASADDCSDRSDCFDTIARAFAAATAIGTAVATLPLWVADVAGRFAVGAPIGFPDPRLREPIVGDAGNAPDTIPLATEGFVPLNQPMTPEEQANWIASHPPDVQFDPWGQAIVSGFGDAGHFVAEGGTDVAREVISYVASEEGVAAIDQATDKEE